VYIEYYFVLAFLFLVYLLFHSILFILVYFLYVVVYSAVFMCLSVYGSANDLANKLHIYKAP